MTVVTVLEPAHTHTHTHTQTNKSLKRLQEYPDRVVLHCPWLPYTFHKVLEGANSS